MRADRVNAAKLAGAAIISLLAASACAGESDGEAEGAEAEASATVVTSSQPPDQGGDAEISGALAVDADGCVVLDHPELGETLVAWPTGFTAKDDGGTVALVDADGQLVAHLGDQIVSGGSYGQFELTGGEECVGPGGELAAIQSEIEVVPQ